MYISKAIFIVSDNILLSRYYLTEIYLFDYYINICVML